MECIFYGVGTPYVYDVFESALRLGWKVAALVSNIAGGSRPDDLGSVIDAEALGEAARGLPFVFPLVTPGFRKRLDLETAARGFEQRVAIVDPTAIVASSARLGDSALVNAGALLAAQVRLGRQVLVNRSASIGHHSEIDDYASIGPGCVLCGSVRVGRGAFLGGGAVVSPEREIGANAIVGSGAVVVRDVPPNCVVVGNPARVIREKVPGYNDAAV